MKHQPRKRGRPRKNVNIQEEDPNTPAQRQRRRKRKRRRRFTASTGDVCSVLLSGRGSPDSGKCVQEELDFFSSYQTKKTLDEKTLLCEAERRLSRERIADKPRQRKKLITCKRCGGERVRYKLFQRRSSDEGSSAYFACSDCNRQWMVD